MLIRKTNKSFSVREGSSQLLLRNYKFTFITRTIIRVLTLVNSIITVRVLGINDYGGLVFLLAFTPVLSTLISFGTDSVLERWLPLYKKSVPSRIPCLTNLVFLLNVFIAAIVLPTFYFLHANIAHWFNTPCLGSIETLILIVFTSFLFISTPFNQFLKINYEYVFLNLLELSCEVLRIIGFYIVLFSGHFGIRTLILLLTIQQAVKSFVIIIRYFKLTGKPIFEKIPKDDFRLFIEYAVKTFALRLMDIVLAQRGITYYIQFFLGSAALGLFTVLEKVFTQLIVWSLPKDLKGSINTYSLEQFAASGATGLNNTFTRTLSLQWIVSFLICGIVLVNILLFEILYHVSFKEIPLFVISLLFFKWVESWIGVFPFLVLVYNRPELRIYSKLIAIAAQFLLCYFLGAHGLVWFPLICLTTTLVDNLLYMPIIFSYNRDLLKWPGWRREAPAYAASLGLLSLFFMLNRSFFILNPIFFLFLIILWFVGIIPLSVKNDIQKIFRHLLNFKIVATDI